MGVAPGLIRRPAATTALRVGAPVEARFGGGAEWYRGKVRGVNSDGSCNILYDDGDSEEHVPPLFIRGLAAVSRGSAGARREPPHRLPEVTCSSTLPHLLACCWLGLSPGRAPGGVRGGSGFLRRRLG